jgi:endonuclease IV
MPREVGTGSRRTLATDKLPPLLLGAHMSIAGGLSRALERGRSIGCSAIQIFVKNNMQWFAKPTNSLGEWLKHRNGEVLSIRKI